MVARGPDRNSAREIVVRPARSGDFVAVRDIYAASVQSSAASFEAEPPGLDEMLRRWRAVTAARCPYVVAEAGERICGFAYARPFHERAAFAWTVEDSVYVAPGFARRGVGRKLLAEVIAASEAAGFRQMIALISGEAAPASVPLHLGLGFTQAGRLSSVGFKRGRWHDLVHMQRALGRGDAGPPDGSQPD